MVTVERLLPTSMVDVVTAGPVDGEKWCLFVRSGAAANKLRQLIPDLEAHLLQTTGNEIKIRVKVLSA